MKQKCIGMVLLILAVLLTTAACDGKKDTKGTLLDLQLLPETITDALYVKMNYKFVLADNFAGLSDDYKIFVHFWRNKNKEMLLGDDHVPEKPFSKWKKGDTLQYSRVIYIPKFLNEFEIDFEGFEDIKLTVGIYNPKVKDSKIVLSQRAISILTASSQAPEIVHDEGWHQLEDDLKAKDKDVRSWRWASGKAVCIIENKGKECLLIIKGGVDKSKFQDQKIILRINDTVLEEFIPESARFSRKYIVSPEMMGKEDEFKLTIETDKTFVPSALNPEIKDDRELGVQVFFLYFRENTK
ncbi:MAG: hypothetical protein GY765_16410 [bacterium]|nr:hypothetical protein [bacterium]